MNQYIFYVFILVYLFSFTNEKIEFKPDTSGTERIDTFIKNIKTIRQGTPPTYPGQIYGFNAQNCKKRNDQSCYVSLYYKNDWYYFCGKIENDNGDLYARVNNTVDNNNQDFVQAYITEITNDDDDVKKFFDNDIGMDKINKKFKIDCFSQKLRFLPLFTLIYSILLL